MGSHARLKTEDEKYHNLMKWLNLSLVYPFVLANWMSPFVIKGCSLVYVTFILFFNANKVDPDLMLLGLYPFYEV